MKRPRSVGKVSSKGLVKSENLEAIALLSDSARRNELVAIVGTGVSIGLTDGKIPALSWKGLIQDGFAYGITKGKITQEQTKAWQTQLESSDLDDVLGAAEFMGRKLDAPNGDLYARWLEKNFKSVKPTNESLISAIRSLHAAGIPLCTLNYDSLLESVTGLPSVNITETNKVNSWMRRESASVLHIHGSWDSPATCILGIRNYETTLENELRDLIQRSLATFRRLLFIGCGDTFADPNFSALIGWLRSKMKTASPQHYALVSDGDVARRNADASWHGFVEPLSFGAKHSDLPTFLLQNFQHKTDSPNKKSLTASMKGNASSLDQARLLRDYRAFLLQDCGQMTIEGVRADMDTAQRKFDLERLFVPLNVTPTPPEISENDPRRDQKLQEWHKKNSKRIPFGKIFAARKRLALLALPGGGKTLLLKRLAVAFADPGRRTATSDNLPDLDLTPVLIRCREWREHIHRPILSLIQKISEITGRTSLGGLDDALIPLFKTGRSILLVDGLDEIHDDALRTTFVENLEKFLAEYKHTRLVVTSREAGFSLVAPCLARFCERWRVAPLEPDAIHALCDHWHRLMVGNTPEAILEGREVADYLIKNSSLLRLAENPLLLTMLLVVKHGAGRLPPDRVSLYGRAVEVLLDTWNIKGHDPLNPKEAVPQLAYLAYQLLRVGKQTATEKELLDLLEQARENVPQIRRYAKDTPFEFLKRVELRSSLLMEAGRQLDGNGTVPFYQFRHLTFQEYLAAVAAVEGHYLDYKKGDTALTPLSQVLTSEEWKEVIPMASVLARKQAEPILGALVQEGLAIYEKIQRDQDFEGKKGWLGEHPPKLPAPVARLVQCLVEEAEATPETLTSALQLSVLFARRCDSVNDWVALARGPYGKELLHQAWMLYAPMQWRKEMNLDDAFAKLAGFRHTQTFSAANLEKLKQMIESSDREEVGRGLFTCTGLLWNIHDDEKKRSSFAAKLPVDSIQKHLFGNDIAIMPVAAWAWGWIHTHQNILMQNPQETLDALLTAWLGNKQPSVEINVGIGLHSQFGQPRAAWTPNISEAQIQKIKAMAAKKLSTTGGIDMSIILMVAFHARNVLTDEELAKGLADLKKATHLHVGRGVDRIDNMLDELGSIGRKYKKLSAQKRKKRVAPN